MANNTTQHSEMYPNKWISKGKIEVIQTVFIILFPNWYSSVCPKNIFKK